MNHLYIIYFVFFLFCILSHHHFDWRQSNVVKESESLISLVRLNSVSSPMVYTLHATERHVGLTNEHSSVIARPTWLKWETLALMPGSHRGVFECIFFGRMGERGNRKGEEIFFVLTNFVNNKRDTLVAAVTAAGGSQINEMKQNGHEFVLFDLTFCKATASRSHLHVSYEKWKYSLIFRRERQEHYDYTNAAAHKLNY